MGAIAFAGVAVSGGLCCGRPWTARGFGVGWDSGRARGTPLERFLATWARAGCVPLVAVAKGCTSHDMILV